MANNTNNYAQEAATIIKNTIAQIKNDYESFLDYLVENGQYQFYDKQSAFIRRMMFFEEYGNYEGYRKNIKNFIFNTIYPYQRSYDEQDMERAEVIFEERLKSKHHVLVCGRDNEISLLIKSMVEFRKKILDENPILTGELPWRVREDLMNTILRNYSGYQKAKKNIDKLLNKLVSSIISEQIYKSDREYK